MEKRNLKIEIRNHTGSSQSRRLRRNGMLPVSVTFPDQESITASVEEREFIHLARVSRYTDVIYLQSEDSTLNGLKVLVKDVQQEPLKQKVLHVDLQALRDDRPVKVSVPVKLVGTPEGSKLQGGILTQASNAVTVLCLPAKIPQEIELDVSALMVGDRLTASDMKLPEGIILKSNERETIASVVSSRATRLQESEEGGEGEAGEEGAEGEGGEESAEGKEGQAKEGDAKEGEAKGGDDKSDASKDKE